MNNLDFFFFFIFHYSLFLVLLHITRSTVFPNVLVIAVEPTPHWQSCFMSRSLRETICLVKIGLNVVSSPLPLVSIKLVYTWSSIANDRIRAAPRIPIKMLWCEDRLEWYNISNLDEITKVPETFFSPPKCFESVIMSLTSDKSKNNFHCAIEPRARKYY